MSKGDSLLFTGTSGEGRALIDEVIANGDKTSPEKVVMITRDPSGKIVWLETFPVFKTCRFLLLFDCRNRYSLFIPAQILIRPLRLSAELCLPRSSP